MKSDYIVFIGRFQPFHLGHKYIVEEALKKAHKVIIVIGSYRESIDTKNPWTYEERKDMVLRGLFEEQRKRVTVVPLRDYMYADTTWITSLQNIVAQIVGDKSVKIIGHFKDDSSIYLTFFPQWHLLERPNYRGINGTDIRDIFFSADCDNCYAYDKNLPPGISIWLKEWKDHHKQEYNAIVQENKFLKDYVRQWKGTPFPVNFVTTDAVVIQSGHILLVKRGINPGKGKYALPGGFLNTTETIIDGCIRELYEETNINIPKPVMYKSLKEVHVFDHPKRSKRGRIITHAHLFELAPGGPLPKVVGADDAFKAMWIPFNDVGLCEQEIFSDHIHIINHFINVGR